MSRMMRKKKKKEPKHPEPKPVSFRFSEIKYPPKSIVFSNKADYNSSPTSQLTFREEIYG